MRSFLRRCLSLYRLHGYCLLFALLLLLLASLCLPNHAAAEGVTVRVGVYENEPKIFTSSTGKPAGIFIEILEHIAKLEGWELQ